MNDSIEHGNLLTSIAVDLEQESFEDLLNSDHVRIERIVSCGHQSPGQGWYDQSENEWVILLKGEATIEFKHQNSIHLHEGSYLNIPAHTLHRVSWTKPDTQSIWLAVFYD